MLGASHSKRRGEYQASRKIQRNQHLMPRPKGPRMLSTLDKAVSIPVREPNGRRSRSLEPIPVNSSPGEVKRLRDAALRGMAAPEWGTELGRLLLDGKLEPMHYEAGKRWARVIESYYLATGIPRPYPPALAIFSGRGGKAPDPDSIKGRRRRQQENDDILAKELAHEVLMREGRLAARTVRRLVEHDEAPDSLAALSAAREGLRMLARHWHLHLPAK